MSKEMPYFGSLAISKPIFTKEGKATIVHEVITPEKQKHTILMRIDWKSINYNFWMGHFVSEVNSRRKIWASSREKTKDDMPTTSITSFRLCQRIVSLIDAQLKRADKRKRKEAKRYKKAEQREESIHTPPHTFRLVPLEILSQQTKQVRKLFFSTITWTQHIIIFFIENSMHWSNFFLG